MGVVYKQTDPEWNASVIFTFHLIVLLLFVILDCAVFIDFRVFLSHIWKVAEADNYVDNLIQEQLGREHRWNK